MRWRAERRLFAAPHPSPFEPVKFRFGRQFAAGVLAHIEARKRDPSVIRQVVGSIDKIDKRDISLAVLGVAILVVRAPEFIGQSARILLCDRIARRKVHLVGHDEMIRGSLVSCDEEIRTVRGDACLFVQVLGSAGGYG